MVLRVGVSAAGTGGRRKHEFLHSWRDGTDAALFAPPESPDDEAGGRLVSPAGAAPAELREDARWMALVVPA